jgi:hypothetical protein
MASQVVAPKRKELQSLNMAFAGDLLQQYQHAADAAIAVTCSIFRLRPPAY